MISKNMFNYLESSNSILNFEKVNSFFLTEGFNVV